MMTLEGLDLSGRSFVRNLEQARASGRLPFDLTETNPARCGLAWDPVELANILGDRRSAARKGDPSNLAKAREAISSYLASRGASLPPDRIVLTSSRGAAYSRLLKLLCEPCDDVLVPSPSTPLLEKLAEVHSVNLARYALVCDDEWHLDRKSLRKAITRHTRAVVVGNPSEPTGATLSREDLAFAEDLCSTRGIALIADETFADTVPDPCPSVAQASRCLAFHVAGLSGICGLPELEADWVAVAGPDELVAPALERLLRATDVEPSVPAPIQHALPTLLARREHFLQPLRARLTENRSSLALAALREAPWALHGGRGSCWAVLEVGTAHSGEALGLALLEDGVGVHPGSLHGLPDSGYLVVSLLPAPEIFSEALALLDRRLRAPLFG